MSDFLRRRLFRRPGLKGAGSRASLDEIVIRFGAAAPGEHNTCPFLSLQLLTYRGS